MSVLKARDPPLRAASWVVGMAPATAPERMICAIQLLGAAGSLLSPLVGLSAELAQREECCLCCAQPAVPRVGSWRFVDGTLSTSIMPLS
jgi:hypothetical protein